MILNLGNHTTAPLTSIGVSVNYDAFMTVNVSAGTNVIPLSSSATKGDSNEKTTSVVRINVEQWQNNRMNLESIILNNVCAKQK